MKRRAEFQNAHLYYFNSCPKLHKQFYIMQTNANSSLTLLSILHFWSLEHADIFCHFPPKVRSFLAVPNNIGTSRFSATRLRPLPEAPPQRSPAACAPLCPPPATPGPALSRRRRRRRRRLHRPPPFSLCSSRPCSRRRRFAVNSQAAGRFKWRSQAADAC